MTPRYSVLGHPLLTAEAEAVGEAYPDELEAHASVAETVLGLMAAPLFTGDWFDRATQSVALQVNLQVEIGIPAFKSQTQGARSWTYRDVPIDPLALAMVEEIIAEIPEDATVALAPRESYNATAVFRF